MSKQQLKKIQGILNKNKVRKKDLNALVGHLNLKIDEVGSYAPIFSVVKTSEGEYAIRCSLDEQTYFSDLVILSRDEAEDKEHWEKFYMTNINRMIYDKSKEK